MKAYFQKMAAEWPGEFVSRKQIAEFSHGCLTASTMANYDTRGVGPNERIKVGHDVLYPKAVLVEWLCARCIVCSPEKKE